MERTESVVVQVAPDYENEKIKEMEAFGWNLQSRQEMHVEGDAEGKPSLTGGSYIVTTKISHYVKLHFVRSLDLANLNEIKRIESEYSGLPFPSIPSIKGPLILIGVAILAMIGGGGRVEALPLAIIIIALGGYWYYSRNKKRNNSKAICEESLNKREMLRKKAVELAS